MKKQYYTSEARQSAIDDIERLKGVLLETDDGSLSTYNYWRLVQHLNRYEQILKDEMKNEKG